VGWNRGFLPALLPAAYAGLCALAYSEGRRGRSRLVAGLIVTVAMVAGLSGLIGVAIEHPGLTSALQGATAADGLIGYSTALGLIQLASIPIWVRFAAKGGIRIRRVSLVALVITGMAIVAAHSRLVTAMAAVLAVVILVWPLRILGAGRDRALLPLAAWFSGVLVVAVLGVAGGSGLSSTAQQVKQDVDHGRIGLWQDSLPAVGKKPVSGHGAGSFFVSTRTGQASPVLYAHNMVVESAVENGIAGAILMAIVFAGALIESWRRRWHEPAWDFLPLVAGFVLLGLTDWVWHLSAVGAIWALALGSVMAMPRPCVRPKS